VLDADYSHSFRTQMYISWLHEPTLQEVTKRRYGSVYPWPLSSVLPILKGRQVCNKLRSFGWAEKSIDQVRLLAGYLVGVVDSSFAGAR
jgi:hypothetical protein